MIVKITYTYEGERRVEFCEDNDVVGEVDGLIGHMGATDISFEEV